MTDDLMDYLDEYAYEEERINKTAVLKLIDAHREEYDALAENFREKRIEELERRVLESQKTIAQLKGLNPNGTQVPALEQTANMLLVKNEELASRLATAHKEIASLEKKLRKFQDAVAEVKT